MFESIPPRLSRDELVTIITDYYVFLTTFYLAESAIKYPPAEGWSNITPETTKDSGKSDIVIDLIKHLPYIDEDKRNDFVCTIHYKSNVVDYSQYTPSQFTPEFLEDGEESLQEHLESIDEHDDDDDDNFEDFGPISLSNCILLAMGHESGGRTLIVDVHCGDVYEDMERCDFLGGMAVEHFFADLKEDFEKLRLVPRTEEMYEQNEVDGPDPEAVKLIEIYRECGWSGEGYRKGEAIRQVKELEGEES